MKAFILQKQKQKTLHSSLGAGLIEVVVSLLILGVGLLGVLSLQAKGLSSNQRALFVTDAQILAQDMVDKIIAFGQSNTGANQGEYDATNTGTGGYTDPSCTNSGCTADEARDYDRWDWDTIINASGLPGGYGQIVWAANPIVDGLGTGGTYTVRVFWDQDRTGASTVSAAEGVVNCSPADKDTFLTCFEIDVELQGDLP